MAEWSHWLWVPHWGCSASVSVPQIILFIKITHQLSCAVSVVGNHQHSPRAFTPTRSPTEQVWIRGYGCWSSRCYLTGQGLLADIEMPSVCLLSDNVKLCCVTVAGLGFQKVSPNLERWELQPYNEPVKNREWDYNPNPGDLSWGSRETVL